MSLNLEPSAAGQNAIPEPLRELVEELATKLVTGQLDDPDWPSQLDNVRVQAATSGHFELERIASDALVLFSVPPDNGDVSSLLSSAIVRMQGTFLPETSNTSSSESAPLATPAEPSAATASLIEDRELVGDLILESREHLTRVEVQMMSLEKHPDDAEAINTVFRGFHTIKGLAGFMNLQDVQEVAHETETLLDLARNRKLTITPPVVDIVLAAADFLKTWMTRLETALAGNDPGAAPEKAALIDRVRLAAQSDTQTITPPAKIPAQPSAPAPTGDRRKGPSADWKGPERRSGADRRTQDTESSCVKVDTAKLDFLVDMAGEMVIAQSMVRHHPELAALRSPALVQSLAQLARITGELQKTAMSMRMIPIGGLFQKMSRLVRDLARKTGRQAELETSGDETELDRNIVEELADPLMHMVRNAVDHGLEFSEERIAAGKDPVGRVRLRACHQAGHIVIEISDDGRGLNREKILAKARRLGLVEDGASLSDREIFNFIFYPGFSTASEVTDVSGRGVGMDVVKKRIQKLRGVVDIDSTPGKGTTFLLRLPLTMAIIDGLVVGVGRERYVIPIFSVRGMLRPTSEMLSSIQGRQEMALVREHLLPVVRLAQRFAVRPRSDLATECILIVAEAAGKSFCVMVDELIGKQEVVIKSLGETFREVPGVAGGTILGDGRVGLILDLEGIFRGEAQ